MASYNVSVRSEGIFEPELGGWQYYTSINPSSLDVQIGDTVTWNYVRLSGGASSVTISGFDSGEWNSTASATLSNGQSVTRTITGAGSDSIKADFPLGYTDRYLAVTATSPNAAPNAAIFGDSTGIVGTAISVDASASTDPDGDTINYSFVVTKNAITQFTRASSTTPNWSWTPTSTGTYVTTVTASDGSLSDTATLTTVVNASSGSSGSSGGYGFEIFDKFGNLVLDNNMMLIRKGPTITTNSSGAGSTTVNNLTSTSRLNVPVAGNDLAKFTVTGTGTSRTVSITGGFPNTVYPIAIMR